MTEAAEDRRPWQEVVDTALGRRERPDPVVAGSGGPAGNALLTAYLGLVLLVLFFLEGLTLFDVRGLITWHVALGALLVPPAVAKTVATGWRMLRYYFGQADYRAAGPPPLLLRLLGPLVVVSTLLLLGSGIVLILVGEQAGRRTLLDVLGLRLDWLFVHQAAFWFWVAVMTAHVLSRTLPAVHLAIRRRRVPGLAYRVVAVALSLVMAAGAAVWLVGAKGTWGTERFDDHRDTGASGR